MLPVASQAALFDEIDKITCYSILGENVQSCEVTVCSQKVTFIK